MNEQPRRQISVGLDEALRAELEAAAERSVRSLSGEIVWRLRQSLEQSPPAASA
jgi:hypothetical protein